MRASQLSFLAPAPTTPDVPKEIAEEISRLIQQRNPESGLLLIGFQMGQLGWLFEPYNRCGYMASIFQKRDEYLATMLPAFNDSFTWLKKSEQLYEKYPRLPEPRSDLKNVQLEKVNQQLEEKANAILNAPLRDKKEFSKEALIAFGNPPRNIVITPNVPLPHEPVLNTFASFRMWGTFLHRLLSMPNKSRDEYLEENFLRLFSICLHYGEINMPRYLLALCPQLANKAEALPMLVTDLEMFAHHMERVIKETEAYKNSRESVKQQAEAALLKALPDDAETRDFMMNTPGEDLHNLSWLPKNQTLQEYYQQRIDGFKTLVDLFLQHGPGIDKTVMRNKVEISARSEAERARARLIAKEIPDDRKALLNSVLEMVVNKQELLRMDTSP